MADFLTNLEHKGRLEGLKLAYVGDSNNVSNSLMFAAARFGTHIAIGSPEGYQPKPEVAAWTRAEGAKTGSTLLITAAHGAALRRRQDSPCGQDARRGALCRAQTQTVLPCPYDYIMGRIHYPDAPWKRRVVAFVYLGPDAVKKIRDIGGPTNPHVARDDKPGCVRALGTVVSIMDAQGNKVGERMDNLIHASATDAEAEREIKLWFKPGDIPPLMRAYPTEVNEQHYYFRDHRLSMTYEAGSICFLAPGETVWKSGLEALRFLIKGQPSPCSVEAVVAKYLINEKTED